MNSELPSPSTDISLLNRQPEPGDPSAAGFPAADRLLAQLQELVADLAQPGVSPTETAVEFDLHEELEELLQTLAPRAHAAGLEVICQTRAPLPARVGTDSARLRQVLTSLIDTSIGFTQKGEVVLEVAVEEVLAGRGVSPSSLPWSGPAGEPRRPVRLRFGVRDTSLGIPPEKLRLLLEPVSAEETRPNLALTACLIQSLGGRLLVQSELGRGSLFSFAIPVLPGRPVLAAPPSAPVLRNRSLLLADDSPTIRAVVGQWLGSWEMRATLVESGSQALRAIQEAHAAGTPFDLVLLDARMPHTSGFAVAEKLAQRPRVSGPVLLLMSAPFRHSDEAYCRRLGIAGRVAKPLRRRELFETLVEMMEGLSEGPVPTATTPSFQSGPVLTLAPLLRVLVAEEQTINQHLIARTLEKRGHAVTLAASSWEAVHLVHAMAFDVVLVALQLPGLEGSPLFDLLRQGRTRAGRRVPVLALVEDPNPANLPHFDGVLTMPPRARDLFAVLDRLAQSRPSSATSGPAVDPAVFDRTTALARVDGDENLFRELFHLFLGDQTGWLAECAEAAGQGDSARLRRLADRFRTALLTFAAARALEPAMCLLDLSRRGDLDSAPGVLAELRERLAQLRQAVGLNCNL